VDVQLLACHPPKEAAPAFEAVIAAEREQDRVRYAAQAYANRILAEVAGYPDEALRLAQVIQQLQELETLIALGREGGDVAGRARQGLVQAAAEATKLRKEIEAERLLGRSAADRPGVTADLLERQDAFVALLKEIQADPRRFDLDGPLQQAQREAEDLFAGVPGKSPGVQGRAAVLVDQARSYRWRTEFAERARAETFGVELTALRAAPSLYRLDKYLEVLSTALQPRRKYVFGLDRNRVEVWLNLEQPPQSFGDITFGKEQ
jgi:hypothetical protein